MILSLTVIATILILALGTSRKLAFATVRTSYSEKAHRSAQANSAKLEKLYR
ncbi:MAG: hypothetical protein V4674_02265 [Patescibacteria group bacterium]